MEVLLAEADVVLVQDDVAIELTDGVAAAELAERTELVMLIVIMDELPLQP